MGDLGQPGAWHRMGVREDANEHLQADRPSLRHAECESRVAYDHPRPLFDPGQLGALAGLGLVARPARESLPRPIEDLT